MFLVGLTLKDITNYYLKLAKVFNRGGIKGRPIFGFKERSVTVLIEVKLIINNPPLTYVSPNTIETLG